MPIGVQSATQVSMSLLEEAEVQTQSGLDAQGLERIQVSEP